MFKCPYCNKSYEKMISLSIHCRKGHHKSAKQLYTDYYLNGIEPVCKCSCKGEVKFLDISRGFREYILGHTARIPGKNNFHKNGGFEKSLETRRRMFREGKIKIWNEGLTKETDKRLADYGRRGRETVMKNKKELERRSKLMKKNRLNRTIPNLYGPQHSQWKGGTSALVNVCRSNTLLYKKWIKPKLIKASFKCEFCNSNKELHVHHDKESFSKILKNCAQKNNWEKNITARPKNYEKLFYLKNKISNEVAQYHINNNISGIVLCKTCHKKEHKKIQHKRL